MKIKCHRLRFSFLFLKAFWFFKAFDNDREEQTIKRKFILQIEFSAST